MRIEAFSIRAVTVAIICMIGLVAIVLSLLAGTYFRRAALDSQMNSLSRVIEVAAQEMLKEVGQHSLDLGMKLAHSKELRQALQQIDSATGRDRLVALLDDPFVSGFVGFSKIDLQKLRIFSLDLKFISESRAGIDGLERRLAGHLVETLGNSKGADRLKAVDALWLSGKGPLYSTLVPLGGLRAVAYLEVIVNPSYNLPDIGYITNTPISIFSMGGSRIGAAGQLPAKGVLPVEYTLYASAGEPAFRIVGYENVDRLNAAMERTQLVTTGGFLALTLGTLLFALWLFNRFLFVPLGKMVENMKQIALGKLDLAVSKKGLREFSTLAESFESMASQVKIRTGDLQRLLDLDDSAILCFGHDAEAVYFNKSAAVLFGYPGEDVSDLDLGDMFVEDIAGMMNDSSRKRGVLQNNSLHTHLGCIRRDGHVFQSDAVINPLDVVGGFGYTVVLNPVVNDRDARLASHVVNTIEKNEQRMHAVEQSLNSILEIARNNPGLISGVGNLDRPSLPGLKTEDDKRRLREQVVHVMQSALACWEHDLGKNKLDLAEESKIWPVYIDKSTPTTRTLDRYLNIESCPKNPRAQRVIDTANFILKQLGKRSTTGRKQLQQALADFRLLLSGMNSAGR